MGLLQSLFAAHGPGYLERFGGAMSAGERKALRAAMACRTPAAGLMVCACDACASPTVLPRSCGNRHCPTCQVSVITRFDVLLFGLRDGESRSQTDGLA